jgi:predicted GTPase
MSRWRIALVLFLMAVPFTGLAVIGSVYLWWNGLGFIAWWPMAACMILGYLLGWYWQRKQMLLKPIDFTPPMHWTERDHQAKQLVEARAQATADLDREKLSDLNFYLDTAKALALELAQFYHPGAKDPVGSLTVPEVLAVIELAAHDLAERVDRYVPGGHLLTVDHWMRAKQAADWAPALANLYWIGAALFDPVGAGLRFAASRLSTTSTHNAIHQYLLVWFYQAFVERVGTYLIEVNSGRLRVGAERYRELVRSHVPERDMHAGPPPEAPPAAAPPVPAADEADLVRRVTVTLFGQVKVGKSSLINALLGEQRALTDVLPATKEIARYELQPPGIPTRLALLDTVGYAHTGPRADQLQATKEAAQHSDVLLLVLHARNPARQADLQMLQQLRDWYASRPDLKRPPIVAVLTHIDLLSPAMEWAPPYDWQLPKRAKEQEIQQALVAAREQLGYHVATVLPVCTAQGKVYGVDEWLLPAVAEVLDEAHAVALLRCLKAEADTGKVQKVFRQLLAVGQEVLKVAMQGMPR